MFHRLKLLQIQQLAFEQSEEVLDHGVIQAVSLAAHTLPDALVFQHPLDIACAGIANLAAYIAAEADEKIAEADEGKSLKYPRRSSSNRTIHFLCKAFIRLLFEPESKIRDAMLRRIFDSIAENPVSIVPNRSPARHIPRKKRFYIAKKSVL
jgi:hypothetical protein